MYIHISLHMYIYIYSAILKLTRTHTHSPFLDESQPAPRFSYDKVADYLSGRTARAEAKARAMQTAMREKDEREKRKTRRANERHGHMNPVVLTVLFKTPTRRSTSSLPAFEVMCSDELWPKDDNQPVARSEHQPAQRFEELEGILQRMDIGQNFFAFNG